MTDSHSERAKESVDLGYALYLGAMTGATDTSVALCALINALCLAATQSSRLPGVGPEAAKQTLLQSITTTYDELIKVTEAMK